MAASMVSPITNSWPRMLMAWRTAVRITGSPSRPTSDCSTAPPVLSSKRLMDTARPVSISPQVEAFTSRELECPRCSSQWAGPSLSAISSSAVCRSGTRSRDSARHISATPSSLCSPNSLRNASSMVGPLGEVRTLCTSSAACSTMFLRVVSSRLNSSASLLTSGISRANLCLSIRFSALLISHLFC